jgi:hypothetical protein
LEQKSSGKEKNKKRSCLPDKVGKQGELFRAGYAAEL